MQQHPTNNLCRTLAGRAMIQQREEALAKARWSMFDRDPSPAKLMADCKTLMRDGDHIDFARAEMVRARIHRTLRAATPITQGGAA